MEWTEGLTALVFGIAILVIGLINIILIVKVFKTLNPKKKTQQTEVLAPVVPATALPQQQDDSELVAVITAAIASMLNTTTDRLVVTSFRQINKSTHWQAR